MAGQPSPVVISMTGTNQSGCSPAVFSAASIFSCDAPASRSAAVSGAGSVMRLPWMPTRVIGESTVSG